LLSFTSVATDWLTLHFISDSQNGCTGEHVFWNKRCVYPSSWLCSQQYSGIWVSSYKKKKKKTSFKAPNFQEFFDPSSQLPDLLPTLLQIFLTIKLGWLAGFFKILSPSEAKGLNIFVGKFSLPVLIFVSLAGLNFRNVDWSFLLAITISKTIIFVSVGFVQFVIHSPKDVSRAAIFSIFCTQTNDFGIGLPILDAVYGAHHPFVGLLYIVAPISLLILNPAGFILMEADKNTTKEKKTFKENPTITPSGRISNELERKREEKKMPFIVATYVYASSQGQRTHSARTNNE
jgi:hypothetical protein